MRYLFLLCIMFGALYSIKSDEIKCEFKTDSNWACGCHEYSCFATGLEVLVSDKNFDSVSGGHWSNKNINDVKHLEIRDSKVLFMPKSLDRLFNLTSLLIMSSSLMKIQSNDFIGLENLKYLHLGNNMLNYLPSDVFSRIPKVIYITLRDNYIKELPRDIFKHNLELEGIWIYNNNFKYISPTIFNHLTKLNRADITGPRHTCLKSNYDGIDQITNLKKDVLKCANPNEETLTIGELFKVLENCDMNTSLFVKVVKSIQKVQDLANTTEIERKCENLSSFFSLFIK